MNQVDQIFAKVALKNGFVEQAQLSSAMAEYRGSGQSGTFGDVLREQGFLNDKQHRAIARYIAEKASGTPADGAKSSGRQQAGGARGGETEIPPLAQLLKEAKAMGASDLHLNIGTTPFVRLFGKIKYLRSYQVVEAAVAKDRIDSLLTAEQRDLLHKQLDLDTSIALDGIGRFRTSVVKQRRGWSAVFRVIGDKVPSLEELGLPESIRRFTAFHQGIVLVTGAAGSGKSSTLAALIEIINQTRRDHVITLEDPIEFVFGCQQANVTQRQVNVHTQSWGNALRAALREDPDVIMVGEMRDLETMRLAVTAAETGHLVLGTLHTTNATRTIDRLLDVFPPKEQAQIRTMVSESLRGVISQQLIPRANGDGRVAAVEILTMTPAVANLIRERQTFKLFSVMQTGRKFGMQLMDDGLARLVESGEISLEEARGRAKNPKRFAEASRTTSSDQAETRSSRTRFSRRRS